MTGKYFFQAFFLKKEFALVTCKQTKNWVGNSRVLVKHIRHRSFPVRVHSFVFDF